MPIRKNRLYFSGGKMWLVAKCEKIFHKFGVWLSEFGVRRTRRGAERVFFEFNGPRV